MASTTGTTTGRRARDAAAVTATGAAVPAAASAAETATTARLHAALPHGVLLEAMTGPWMLAADDVEFDVDAAGRRRPPIRDGAGALVYTGTLRGDAVNIEQASLSTAATINEWLARVQRQCSDRAEGASAQVRGALVVLEPLMLDGDDGSITTFYTVRQREADSVASLVLRPGGAAAHIDTAARLRLVWQSATALAALHARGVVHGDVAPTTVLLTSVAGAASVRVTGFDSPRSIPSDPSHAIYCDPVLLAAAADGADGGATAPVAVAASDVYSWGIMAWQVLTGMQPLAPVPAASVRSVVCGSEGQRPPTAALEEVGVPAAVVEVIRQCWAPDQGARPTMAAVAQALAAAIAAAGAAAPVSGRDGAALLATLRSDATTLEEARGACVALHFLVATGTDAALALQRDGCVTALAAALQRHDSDVGVARCVCGTLAALAAAAATRVALLGGADGVAAVGATLLALQQHGGDLQVSRADCTTLERLSADEGGREVVVGDRGLEAAAMVAAALQAHVDDLPVAHAACGTLWHLAALEVGMGETGVAVAVAALAALQRHGDGVVAARAACDELFNAEAGEDVGDAAAAVEAALQRYESGIETVRAACGTVRCVAANIATHDVHAAAGMAAAIASALQRHVSDVVVAANGCWAIYNLAPVPADDAAAAAPPEELGAGVGAAVLSALLEHTGNAQVAAGACAALQRAAAAEADLAALVQGEVAGTVVITVLQRHVADLAAARAACGALQALSATDASYDALLRDRYEPLMAALVPTLQRHAGDVAVVRGALGTLANMMQTQEPTAQTSQVAAAAIAALQQHAGDVAVVRSACAVVTRVIAVSTAIVTDHREAAVVAASTVLQRHVGNLTVARAACGALASATSPLRKLVVGETCAAAVSAVVSALLEHAGDGGVAAESCRVLMNVSLNKANLALLVGAAAVMVAALQRHGENVDVATAACHVLWNCTSTKASCKALVRGLGGAAPVATVVAAAMQAHAAVQTVVRVGCNTLRNMAAVRAYRARLLRDEGAGLALVAALQQHPVASDMLRCAVEPHVGCPSLVRDHARRIATAVSEALQAEEVSNDVAENGCAILCILASSATGDAPAQLHIATAVVAMLQRVWYCAPVARATCTALRHLATEPAIRNALVLNHDAVESVCDVLRGYAMKQPGIDRDNVVAAVGALYTLAQSGLALPIDATSARVVRRLMDANRAHPKLQDYCSTILTLLA